MKRLVLVLACAVGFLAVQGCSSGDVSVNDIQKNGKAQADWIKKHPPAPDTHIE